MRSRADVCPRLLSKFPPMTQSAQEEKRDIFLVDTGDQRVGHGLTDLIPSGNVNGQFTSQLYLEMGYDALVPGKSVV